MVAGIAEELFAADPTLGPIMMAEGPTASARWNPIWLGNPAIWVPIPGKPVPPRLLMTGRGHLPYIENPYTVDTGWRFTDWRASEHRGHIYLTEHEIGLGRELRHAVGPYVLIEPTAPRKHINRRPPRRFWHDLMAEMLLVIPPMIAQLDYEGADILGSAIRAPHTSFREACGILAGASLVITTEGGLAHAAAALGIPAVVLWGGMISAPALSYPEHVNLVDPSPETPCGRLRDCPHCLAAWQALDPAMVATVAAALLQPPTGQVA